DQKGLNVPMGAPAAFRAVTGVMGVGRTPRMCGTGIPLLRCVETAECLAGSAVWHGSILDVENGDAVTDDR
ncbi:MAG: hypothetical protein WA753_12490, partial [Pseudolabrys sp.]